MASGNRTLAEEVEFEAGLIKTILILGATLFVVFIVGVGLLL